MPNDTVAPTTTGLPYRSALLGLESAVCDAALMADLAADVIGDALSDRAANKAITGRDDVIFMTPRQADMLIFAALQSWRMASALRDAYYAAIEGGRS